MPACLARDIPELLSIIFLCAADNELYLALFMINKNGVVYNPLFPAIFVWDLVSSWSLNDGIISQGTTIPSITPLDNDGATLGTGIPTGVAPSFLRRLVADRVGPLSFKPLKSSKDFISVFFVCIIPGEWTWTARIL